MQTELLSLHVIICFLRVLTNLYLLGLHENLFQVRPILLMLGQGVGMLILVNFNR
jgi:hypothetical protein